MLLSRFLMLVPLNSQLHQEPEFGGLSSPRSDKGVKLPMKYRSQDGEKNLERERSSTELDFRA